MTDNSAGVGRRGIIRLTFEKKNRTVIAKQFAQAPYHVQRAIYDTERADMAHVYLMSSSGGILGQDSHLTDISLGADAAARITTQGATRIYDTAGHDAVQTQHIRLAPHSYLEFLPDYIVPYRHARYCQSTDIIVDDSACMVYAETVSAGRISSGEVFEYDSCIMNTTAVYPDGRLRFVDAALMQPRRRDMSLYGIMGGHVVYGSVYVLVCSVHVSDLCRQFNDMLSEATQVTGGASIMYNDSGVLVRMLADRTDMLADLCRKMASEVRRRVSSDHITKF